MLYALNFFSKYKEKKIQNPTHQSFKFMFICPRKAFFICHVNKGDIKPIKPFFFFLSFTHE